MPQEFLLHPSPARRTASNFDFGQVTEWTPAITFATPGDLAVTYEFARGHALTILREFVFVYFDLRTDTFTHSTASGTLNITGFPFLKLDDLIDSSGTLAWGGIAKASYTQATLLLTGSNIANVVMSGSGQDPTFAAAADCPSGGIVFLKGSLFYRRRP